MQLKLVRRQKCVGNSTNLRKWPPGRWNKLRRSFIRSIYAIPRYWTTQENILGWKVNLNWFQIIFSLSIVRPVLSENQWPWKWKWRHVSSLRQNAYATGWSCVVTHGLKMKTRSTMRAMLLSQQVLNRKKELDFDEIFAFQMSWNLFFAAFFDS